MKPYDIFVLGLNACELIACVVGFIYWKKIKNTYWKWFPVYLGILFLVEMTGKVLRLVFHDNETNTALYRYFGIPIQFLFFFWLFYCYFSNLNKKDKRWPLTGAAIYIGAWFTEWLFFEKVKAWFMSFSYTMGNIVLLVLVILFFIRFINSEMILKYRESLMFWVCLGLLAFYLGTFPYYALRNTLYSNLNSVFKAYSYVSLGLDYLMYIFFTIAFICGRPK
jgi:hypothetical protein